MASGGHSIMGIFARKGNGRDKRGPGANGEIQLTSEVEGAIRDLVARDVVEQRRHREDTGEEVAHNLSELLQCVSMNSVQEIDLLINELKALRARLLHDGDRMAREVIDYASLGNAAM